MKARDIAGKCLVVLGAAAILVPIGAMALLTIVGLARGLLTALVAGDPDVVVGTWFLVAAAAIALGAMLQNYKGGVR